MIAAGVIAILLVAQLPLLFIMSVFLGAGAANSGNGAAAFGIPFLVLVVCGIITISRAFGPGIRSPLDFAIASLAFAPLGLLTIWAAQDWLGKVFADPKS